MLIKFVSPHHPKIHISLLRKKAAEEDSLPIRKQNSLQAIHFQYDIPKRKFTSKYAP
jgi:hypothetical protein